MTSNTMVRQLRYSWRSTRPLAQNERHQMAARHALCHYPSGAIYSFIPKNACSTMRLSLAIANGAIRGPQDHAWIHGNNQTFTAGLRELLTAPFSFVILRDPLQRLASAFLDKIVERSHDFWVWRTLLGHKPDPEDLTFETFVSTILEPGNLRSNEHWRPQSDFLVYENYDLWIPFERFQEFVPVLEERTGMNIVDARGLTLHGTDRFKKIEDGCFAQTAPSQILAMKLAGSVPAHSALYTPELEDRVRKAYAGDEALYREKCI